MFAVTALDFHALGVVPGVPDGAAAATCAERLLQVILPLFAVRVVFKENVSRQLAVGVAAARSQHSIDFVLRNEGRAFFFEIRRKRELSGRKHKLFQPLLNVVGAMEMEPQHTQVLVIDLTKGLQFLVDNGPFFGVVQKLRQFCGGIRKTAFFPVDLIHKGKKVCFMGGIAKVLPQIPEFCSQFGDLVITGLSGTFRRKIVTTFHKISGALFNLCPG